MKRNMLIIVLSVILNACTLIEYETLPPQLEIKVFDVNDNVIPDVNVSLFLNQEDWENDTNVVMTGMTNSGGSVVFDNLDELVYFFKAEKDGLSNDLDIVSFNEPLKKGEKRIIKTKIQ